MTIQSPIQTLFALQHTTTPAAPKAPRARKARRGVTQAHAEAVGLHDTRWMRKDELAVFMGRISNGVSIPADRVLAGALRNGRVRLTPSAEAYVVAQVGIKAGERVCDRLARWITASV